jgi:hypothetical protein
MKICFEASLPRRTVVDYGVYSSDYLEEMEIPRETDGRRHGWAKPVSNF